MAITTYAQLKTAIGEWALRSGDSDFTGRTGDFIALAEGQLNDEIGAVEADATLTGTLDSRRITTGLTIEEPIALFLAESGLDERTVQIQPDGSFPYLDASGKPSVAALDEGGTYIDFDRPLDAAYPFRFRYRGRLALSDSVTTNWLLEKRPDIYLAASMMWGAGYQEDWPNGGNWASLLKMGIPQIRRTLSLKKKGTLRVDPALAARRNHFDYTTGQ
jgi:hypothetical protein